MDKYINADKVLDEEGMTKEEAIKYVRAFKLCTPYTMDSQGVFYRAVKVVTEALEQLIKDLSSVTPTQTIPLDRVKRAREKIEDKINNYPDRNISEYEDCLAILDELIAEYMPEESNLDLQEEQEEER